MKSSQRVFETQSIDLASYLTGKGYVPTVKQANDCSRAIFSFSETTEMLDAIIDYERGGSLPAKRLLNVRSWLYRQASEIMKRAGAIC